MANSFARRLLCAVLVVFLCQTLLVTVTSAESVTINFRELISEKTLSKGTYRQIDGTNLQFFLPDDLFIEVEIPQKKGYEDTVLILSYKDDPFGSIEIETGETEQTFEEVYYSLDEKGKEGKINNITACKVNGFQCVFYQNGAIPGTILYPYIYVYIVDGRFVKYTVNISNHEDFNKHANWVVLSLEHVDQKQ